MGEWIGVSIALLSSCLGGTAAAITRYLVTGADPISLAILRWGIGFVCLLPAAFLLNVRWPPWRDWPAVALLGLAFFGLFFILYNIAIGFTTAARATLALATLPLHTMVVAALLGVEPLTLRKSIGVGVAVLGMDEGHVVDNEPPGLAHPCQVLASHAGAHLAVAASVESPGAAEGAVPGAAAGEFH